MLQRPEFVVSELKQNEQRKGKSGKEKGLQTRGPKALFDNLSS